MVDGVIGRWMLSHFWLCGGEGPAAPRPHYVVLRGPTGRGLCGARRRDLLPMRWRMRVR